MKKRSHRIRGGSRTGPLFGPSSGDPHDPVARFAALRARLAAVGLDDGIDLQILRACGLPPTKRGKVPWPGTNLVWDRHYADLRGKGLLRRHHVHAGLSSFSDYDVLTAAGRKVLTGRSES